MTYDILLLVIPTYTNPWSGVSGLPLINKVDLHLPRFSLLSFLFPNIALSKFQAITKGPKDTFSDFVLHNFFHFVPTFFPNNLSLVASIHINNMLQDNQNVNKNSISSHLVGKDQGEHVQEHSTFRTLDYVYSKKAETTCFGLTKDGQISKLLSRQHDITSKEDCKKEKKYALMNKILNISTSKLQMKQRIVRFSFFHYLSYIKLKLSESNLICQPPWLAQL